MVGLYGFNLSNLERIFTRKTLTLFSMTKTPNKFTEKFDLSLTL